MARSIEEILEYIDNREAIAEEMSTIAYYGAYWLPIEKDVKSVSMEDINDYETFIPMDCEDSKQEAQKLLEELDFDFQDAMIGQSDETKEQLNKKYKEKRQFIVEGIEMVEKMSKKTMDNWERFKQGEIISYDDVYGISNAFKAKAKNNIEREETTENRENTAADERPEKAPEDLSTDNSKTLAQLMKELNQAKEERRRAERALSQKRFKEFEADIAESGALYMETSEKTKKLQGQYKDRIAELKKEYKGREAQIDEDEQAFETQLLEDRAELAKKKGDLHDLRKLPIIKNFEKTIREKEKLEAKLEKTTDEYKRAELEAQIKKTEEKEQMFLETDAGKVYKSLTDGIEETKGKINSDKVNIKKVADLRKELKEWLKDYTQKAKDTLQYSKGKQLPAKQNKFMLFIGGIRAKLGIGKHKAEKNVADTLENVLKQAGDMAQKLGEFSAKEAKVVQEAVARGAIYVRDGAIRGAEAVRDGAVATKDAVVRGAGAVKDGAVAAKDAVVRGAGAAKDAAIRGAGAVRDGAVAAKDAVVRGAGAARDAVIRGAGAVRDGAVAAKDAVVRGAGAARDAVSDFYTAQKNNIVLKLESHIQARINSEKQKTQEVQDKINPDAGDR
ncbi:MAG: hypothetical protein IJH12_02480 [Clostridia bacterium]|nr:hypothetical protein [Clostridia bacterium]